jgi:dTDP-4-amino-4,6-dideoxygalactose transaminase
MQSAIGIAELDRIDNWNIPTRKRNADLIIDRIKDLPQVLYCPVDTADRRNGWYVLAFSLDIENMNCDIKEFVTAAVAEGAPVWKVFWPQCHTEHAFQNHISFGNSGFPFKSKEYTNPASADYSDVDVPNARWHELHTFTCFAYPTYTVENCEQIGDALRKVILAYSK